MRKLLLMVCLVAFCLGTLLGCSKPPSGEKGSQKPPASTTAEK